MGTENTRFPRQNRLLDAGAYNRVFQRAKKSSDEFFTILWRANGLDQARLGMAISKKSVKRAVDRNRLKRLIRESFRHHQTRLVGIDFVVLCRRGLPRLDSSRLRGSLERHWVKLAQRLQNS